MKKSLLVFLMFFLIISACEEDVSLPMTGDPQAQPEVVAFELPAVMYTEPVASTVIFATLFHPYDLSQITSVHCNVAKMQGPDVLQNQAMRDDGRLPDSVPGDGVFSAEISLDFAKGQPGDYIFSLYGQIMDYEILYSLAGDTVRINDSAANQPPEIGAVTVPSIVLLESGAQYPITATVMDADGNTDILEVVCDVFAPEEANLPTLTLRMQDDGNGPDVIAADGVYTATLSSNIPGGRVGIYSFRFKATDTAGNVSVPVVVTNSVSDAANEPPVLTALAAPDTLQLESNAVVVITMAVTVTDPQGLDDLRVVYFNSFLPPDGRASSGNPFNMNDNGNEALYGDVTAGDGIYSIKINLPPGSGTGNYTFVFEAEDYSGAHSNQITHVVTVED
ncbi:hypothetical protein KAH55_04270 [bacterium]|nr:hypothetical protein [bacterium]